MAVSKVEITTENGTETLVDLTGDSVTPETLAEGATAHGANGEPIIGTMKAGGADMSKYFETVGGDTITWDGVADGRYYAEVFYHVSDAMPTADELKNGGKFVMSSPDGEVELPFTADNIADQNTLGNPVSTVAIEGEPIAFVVYGLNFTDSFGLQFEKTGVYVMAAEMTDGKYFTKSMTINGYTGFTKEYLKNEYLSITERTKGDTLKWNGKTNGLEQVNGMVYLVSDATPSLDDLKQGGTFKIENVLWAFNQETLVDAETVGLGHGCAFAMGVAIEDNISGNALGFGVVYESGATINYPTGDTVVTFVFEKAGVYFGRKDEIYFTSELTINNYTGFARDVIKKKHLPDEVIDNTHIVRLDFTTNGEYGGYDGTSFNGFDELIQAYDEGKTIKAIMPAFESRESEEQIGELELPLISIPNSREYALFGAINPYYGWDKWTDASYVMLKIESDNDYWIREKPLAIQGAENTETWTFTLEDGTEVTKKVVLA